MIVCWKKMEDKKMHEKIKQLLIDNELPMPDTILHPPVDVANGYRLLRYEIYSNNIFAVVEGSGGLYELKWNLEQIKLCTI